MSTIRPALRVHALCLALLALSLQVMGPLLHARALLAETTANGGIPIGLTICRADGQASQQPKQDDTRRAALDCLLCHSLCATGSAPAPTFAYAAPTVTTTLRPQPVTVAARLATTDHLLPFSRGPPIG